MFIYREVNIEYLLRRLVMQFYLCPQNYTIVCAEMQDVIVDERLKLANIQNSRYEIADMDKFFYGDTKICEGDLILINPTVDLQTIYYRLTEINCDVIIISDGPLKYLEGLHCLLKKKWDVKFYGKNLAINNIPKTEVMEKRRYLAEKELEENFVGNIGISAREISRCILLLINSSSTSLYISSPWWNSSFYIYHTAIEEALKRGVNVTFFYGIGKDDSRKEKTERTIKKLKSDYSKYANIKFKEIKGHCVAVISDNNYLTASQNFTAITDSPWLELADLYYRVASDKIDALVMKIEEWVVK